MPEVLSRVCRIKSAPNTEKRPIRQTTDESSTHGKNDRINVADRARA
jgi:hypothetical protein